MKTSRKKDLLLVTSRIGHVGVSLKGAGPHGRPIFQLALSPVNPYLGLLAALDFSNVKLGLYNEEVQLDQAPYLPL